MIEAEKKEAQRIERIEYGGKRKVTVCLGMWEMKRRFKAKNKTENDEQKDKTRITDKEGLQAESLRC